MKKIIFYLLLLPLVCCKGKEKSEPFVVVGIEDESEFRTPVLGKHGLDKAIVDHLKIHIHSIEQECEIEWNDRKCYTIDFYEKDSTRKCRPNDTIVCFSYYNPTYRKNYDGYRGMLKIANRWVAILDKDRIGELYYDTSKLERVPLENCESESGLLENGMRLGPYLCYLKDGWVRFDRSLATFEYEKEWGVEDTLKRKRTR